jgi:hypothetical protein
MAPMDAKTKALTARIRDKLPQGLVQKLLTGALRVIQDSGNPVRHHLFCAAFRSLFENLLHDLAPDDNIKQCSWFRVETGYGTVSRRQRAVYATQGGLSDNYVKTVLGFDPRHLHKRVTQAIDDLSKYTHVREESLIEDDGEIAAFVQGSLEALESLFAAIEECRRRVVDALEEHIDLNVVDALVSDTLEEVDILATHYWLDDSQIDEVRVSSIDNEDIRFGVRGQLTVVLQWGSDSDYRNDFGARATATFPFDCVLSSPTCEPESLTIDPRSINIDTAAWWEDDVREP